MNSAMRLFVNLANRNLVTTKQNGIMAAAKKLGLNPREFAQKVLEHADLSDIAEKTEIAGPGFINIFLNPTWLANNVSAALKDQNLGVSANEKQTIVIDYSSPNVAKENARRSLTFYHYR